jgi:D-alanyl-lipoteichoic acid acyltransferase DltB (MBOAT superfamily)
MTTVVSSPATTGAAGSFRDVTRDRRLLVLAVLGMLLVGIVLPPLHAALFLLNMLWAYWLSRRQWNWIRRYASFFLGESLYLLVKFQVPRDLPAANPLFRHLFPSNPYALFLWTALEIVFFLKLLDFVLCRVGDRNQREFSFARLFCYVVYPFTLLAGPVMGFDDFYRSYRAGRPTAGDAIYAARKCLWGVLALSVIATWLARAVEHVRTAVLDGALLAQAVDSRLLMWAWLAGLSLLLHAIYKGYVDVMLGLSRLTGFHFPEQFYFTLLSRDPIEYWRNGNRSVYRITTEYVFNRFFAHDRAAPKILMATGASGVFHALMCPGITLAGAVLLGVLFGATGVAMVIWIAASRAIAGRNLATAGPAHNARVLAGVAATFLLMAFPRSGFLLMVSGISVREWFELVWLLFVRV